ncbi:hypothetical protein [Bifidobacterium vansinderenii]|uniref:Uncharacterized protein n=1 Tax=Bifidobacterium vansinderenii TaxID=1984871 RepID=A0A229VZI7_9BIFI|nr:hypothetical protein [Bifidobacterium vansinderenii]OXN01049.1 hypothetical protein Tam10B_0627 [Bifidobacterium vansinderenii]
MMTNDIEGEHTMDVDPEVADTHPRADHIGDGAAGRAVSAYVFDSFGRYRLDDTSESDYLLVMDDRQWAMTRDLLQWYLAMDDLDHAVKTIHDQKTRELADIGLPDANPSPAPPGLPQGWWTLLEAAYERLGDEDGLRRIYACYIVIDRLPWRWKISGVPGFDVPRRGREIDYGLYVRKLKALAGEQWPEDVRRMVRVHQRYYRDPIFAGRQLAYEELLRSERLSDAAWRYCKVRCRSRYVVASTAAELMDTMFDIVVEHHAEDVCNILLSPLRDADSPILKSDSPELVAQVIEVLRKCQPYVENRVHEECERLYAMYRHRQRLRGELKRLLRELGSSEVVG